MLSPPTSLHLRPPGPTWAESRSPAPLPSGTPGGGDQAVLAGLRPWVSGPGKDGQAHGVAEQPGGDSRPCGGPAAGSYVKNNLC